MPRVKRITPTNVDNRLKMPEAGFERWRPHTFFMGWNKDGTMKTREGFKNTLTDQEIMPPEGWNADLSGCGHGDLACVRHSMPGTDEFWAEMEKARDNPLGEVVRQENGRTIIRY